MSKPNAQLTAEAILNIIADTKPNSLTGIAHAMGYKGTISGSVAKRIRELVPNVKDLLTACKTAKDTTGSDASGVKPKVTEKASAKTAAGKKPASVACPIPDCTPYRPTSGYAMVWAILHAHKEKGISKGDLVAKYRAWCKKPLKNCQFDVHVVTSVKQDGACNRSASRAGQHYWIEREGDFLRLHLLSERK